MASITTYTKTAIDRKVPGYNARDYNVIGNGATDDSAAINSLITVVANAGGGAILFPAGTYSIAAPIVLKQGVYLRSLAANHGYGTGVRTVAFAATAALTASQYVVDTVANGIANAGGAGIDVIGNGTCGGVRLSRIAWGCWSQSFISNCGTSALWEGGGFANVFEDLLITNSLLTAPTSAVAGAFDIGNTVDSIQGTDHYVTRSEFAARGTGTALASSNLYVAAAVVRGSNHFITDSIGETSDIGWYVTGTRTSFSHIRADTNRAHGFWLVGGTNVYTGCRSIGNSQNGTGLYDGFFIDAGAWGTRLIAPAVYVAGSIKPRYGINSAISGPDPVYALQLVAPTVEDAGTARYNLSGFYGTVFASMPFAPGQTATPDVHDNTGPYDLTAWTAQTVTNFLGGVDGQTISVLGSANITIANNATIVTSTAANKTLTTAVYRFTRRNSIWYEDADAAGSGGGAATGLGGAFWHNGNQAISAGSVTQITLGNTDFNDDSTNSYVLANNAITVKKYGLYLVSWYGDAGSDGSAGTRSFFAQIGGNTIGEVSTYTSGAEVRLAGSKVIRIAANSTVTLACYFTTAATVYGAAAKDTGISLAYLGG